MLRLALLSLLATLPLLAETPLSISPSSGPTTGGTQVTIKGDFAFGFWSYGVFFGSEGVPATVVDAHTLVAIAPPNLPGVKEVSIFEYDLLLETPLTFEYFGGVPPAFERVLLPIFTEPVHGAFGSEFHTALRIVNSGPGHANMYGLRRSCQEDPFCPTDDDEPYRPGSPDKEVRPEDVAYTGNPGRMLWIEKNDTVDMSFNLRVHDVTRSALNFGTEIPVVRENDWAINRIVLPGVPADPRFRNTLRIYGQFPFIAKVTVGDRAPVRLTLSDTTTLFDVPYAVFSDFPISSGPVRVTIEAESLVTPVGPSTIPMWAMITVTNNDTQLISTITPQP
jgi:hypothetical protein